MKKVILEEFVYLSIIKENLILLNAAGVGIIDQMLDPIMTHILDLNKRTIKSAVRSNFGNGSSLFQTVHVPAQEVGHGV